MSRDLDLSRPPGELAESDAGPPGLDPRLKLVLRRRMQERHAARSTGEGKGGEAEAKGGEAEAKGGEAEAKGGEAKGDESSPEDQAALDERFAETCAQADSQLAALDANHPQASQQLQQIWMKLGIERWLAAYPHDPRALTVRVLALTKQAEIEQATEKREKEQAAGAIGPITGTFETVESFFGGDEVPLIDASGAAGAGDSPKVHRPLDPTTEVPYAKEVFGESLDYTQLLITRHSALAFGNTSRTVGNEINLDEDCFDQSQPPGSLVLTAGGLDTLIHEMTHAWQFQHSGLSYIPEALIAQYEAASDTGDRDTAYEYQDLLDNDVPFAEWNPEQQAQFVQEYNQAHRRMMAAKPEPKDDLFLRQAEPYILQIQSGQGAPPRMPMMPGGPTGDAMEDLGNSIVD